MVEFDLQKKGHRLLIAGFIDILFGGAGNFNHDSCLEKFSDLFQTLPFPCERGPGINVGTRPLLFSQSPCISLLC